MNPELEEYKKLMLKGARRRAIFMGIFLLFPMVFLVNVYIQNARLKEELRVTSGKVTALNIIIQQNQEDIRISKIMLERATIDVNTARESAEACQKSKKK